MTWRKKHEKKANDEATGKEQKTNLIITNPIEMKRPKIKIKRMDFNLRFMFMRDKCILSFAISKKSIINLYSPADIHKRGLSHILCNLRYNI